MQLLGVVILRQCQPPGLGSLQTPLLGSPRLQTSKNSKKNMGVSSFSCERLSTFTIPQPLKGAELGLLWLGHHDASVSAIGAPRTQHRVRELSKPPAASLASQQPFIMAAILVPLYCGMGSPVRIGLPSSAMCVFQLSRYFNIFML